MSAPAAALRSRARRTVLAAVAASAVLTAAYPAQVIRGQTLAPAQTGATGVGGDAARPDRNLVWRLDATVQRAMQDARANEGEATRTVARIANWWGGTGVIVFAALLWLGGRALGRTSLSRVGLRGAEGIAVASAISGIIKGLAGRARPFLTPGEPWHWDFNHGWSDARYFSMPSGHTTATVAFAVAASIAAWKLHRQAGGVFGAMCITSAVVVAFARMYSDQHWLSDVCAGTALGTATSVVLARMLERTPAASYHRVMLGAGARVPKSSA